MPDLVAVGAMNSWRIEYFRSRAMVRDEVSYAMFQRGQNSLVQIPLRQGCSRKSFVLRYLEEGICGARNQHYLQLWRPAP